MALAPRVIFNPLSLSLSISLRPSGSAGDVARERWLSLLATMLLALDRVLGNPDRHLRHVATIRSTRPGYGSLGSVLKLPHGTRLPREFNLSAG